MKIIVTGSLGNISKPLAQELIVKGHDVTIISRKAYKQKEIEALGAKAAVGSVEDLEFFRTQMFQGQHPVNVSASCRNVLLIKKWIHWLNHTLKLHSLNLMKPPLKTNGSAI